jgi:hypothetical protein
MENPRDFHHRVIKAYDLSGYPQEAKAVLIEEAWERGLEPYLQRTICQGPTLEMADKLDAADNTWQYLYQDNVPDLEDFLEQSYEQQEIEPPAPRMIRRTPTKILQRTTNLGKQNPQA